MAESARNSLPAAELCWFRIHTLGPADETGDDAPEAMVAALWNRKAASNPFLRKQEAHIQKAMRLPGGPLHEGGDA